jgi:hypothetical protein
MNNGSLRRGLPLAVSPCHLLPTRDTRAIEISAENHRVFRRHDPAMIVYATAKRRDPVCHGLATIFLL